MVYKDFDVLNATWIKNCCEPFSFAELENVLEIVAVKVTEADKFNKALGIAKQINSDHRLLLALIGIASELQEWSISYRSWYI